MNLYFRLLWLFIKTPFIKKKAEVVVWSEYFRALPSDCDINIHMTNSRYFTFGDLSRMYILARFGVLGKLAKAGYSSVINASELTFIRPIAPLQKFEVRSTPLCWDEKYFYLKHEYFVKEKLCATGLVRGVFLKKGKVVPFGDILGLTGKQFDSPAEPELVTSWKTVLAKKKELS